MGLLERLQSLIGEFEDGGEEDAGMEDAAEDAAGALEAAGGESGSEEAHQDEFAQEVQPREAPSGAESEGTREEEPQAQEDDEADALRELAGKVEALEAKLNRAAGGTTGLEPAGAASTDEADIKRWREIAGLDD